MSSVYVFLFHLCTPDNTTPDEIEIYAKRDDALTALNNKWVEVQQQMDVSIYDVKKTEDRIRIYDYDGTDLLLRVTKEQIL